jgi:hypothetical protein
MAQKIQRLTALAVSRASTPGLYADGAGLYLRVGRGGSKSWALRYMLKGKPREMGLGALTKVSLADARKKASDARLLLSAGRDPLTERRVEETRRAAAEKHAACADGSKSSLIGQKSAGIEPARIRLAGGAISVTYCRRDQRCERLGIMPPSPTPRSQRS